MKKIFIISLLTILLTSCLNNNDNWKINKNISDNSRNNSWKIIIKKELSEEEKIEIQKNQISNIKKKLQLKWLILTWDIDFKNKEYTKALIKYLQIYKEVPNDKNTIKKLWDIYFKLKNYKQSYKYYEKILDYNRLDKNLVATSLISSISLNIENHKYLNEKLDIIWLNEQELFYYKTSIKCSEDLDLCKKDFSEYFKIKEDEENQKKEILNNQDNNNQSTWSVLIEEKFEKLYNIKNALENYSNFQVDDLIYQSALISWAFYENELYPISISTSKKILEERKDYKPLIKIVAKSNYELWNYIQAKLYLNDYNKLVKNDPEISYFLWIVYEKLNEYILSSIHFKKALKIWHEKWLDINRRILVNYYELWDIKKMILIFDKMIVNYEDEINQNDYSMAIYYNILNDNTNKSKNITNKALEVYPDSEIFNWYMWWILMDEANKLPETIKNEILLKNNSWSTLDNNIEKENKLYEKAEKYIIKWLEINPQSPMLNLVKWKLEINKWNIKDWFKYFQNTIKLDKNWDFWKIAKEELELIKINK